MYDPDTGVYGATNDPNTAYLDVSTLTSGDVNDGTYETTITVLNAPGGVYDVSVRVYDLLGNTTLTSFTDVFTLVGPSDTDAPVASFVSISPTSASAGDTVTLTWRVTDATGVDLDESYARMYNPDTGVYAATNDPNTAYLDVSTLTSGDVNDGTYETTITVLNVPTGVYDVSVRAYDVLSNWTPTSFTDVFTVVAG
jgi:hypothetical protein